MEVICRSPPAYGVGRGTFARRAMHQAGCLAPVASIPLELQRLDPDPQCGPGTAFAIVNDSV